MKEEKKVKSKENKEKSEVETLENTEETVVEEVKEEKKKATKKTEKKETVAGDKEKGKKSKKAGPSSLEATKRAGKKHFKKYREVEIAIDKNVNYSIEEAVELAKKTTTTKFDSSVELHISLGIDMKKADQQVRGSLVLPHGTGKTKKVLAIVGADKEKEAKDAGADHVGGADMIDKIVQKNWFDFDVIVATPDMMGTLGKAAKVLGPKGLMPNPKVGTVTPDPAKTIKNIKGGMVEYRADTYGIVHQSIGKVSFDSAKLKENYDVILDTIKKVKPSGTKGTYIKTIYITTTMGPSIRIAL